MATKTVKPFPLLKVESLSILTHPSRPSYLIKNVNFSLKKGKTLAIVGESGSGKSTLALSLLQLLDKRLYVSDKSRICFKGEDLLTLNRLQIQKKRGREIGLILQNALSSLNPVFTVGAQMDEALKLAGIRDRKARYYQSLHYLKEAGLNQAKDYLHAYPHQLSGGMRQRAMIAMVLAQQPDLLIADEPTTALDIKLQQQILTLLQTLQAKYDLSLLLISHDLSMVHQMTKHILVLRQGKVIEACVPKTASSYPKHHYTKKLYQAIQHPNKCLALKHAQESHTRPWLQAKDICIHFQRRKRLWTKKSPTIKAVDGVSFSLYTGKTLALVGESGSGKTTLARSLLGLESLTSGQFNYLTKRNDHAYAKSHHLQMIFQDSYAVLNPRLTIEQSLEESIKIDNPHISKTACEKRIHELLNQVGLSSYIKLCYPLTLSGGERQRVSIARSLSVQPKCLVCDEPTSALDASVQAEIIDLLRQLQQEKHLTYLLISHDFGVVSALADEVAVIYQGRFIEHGKVDQVLFNPKHPYTKSLLAAIPKIPDTGLAFN